MNEIQDTLGLRTFAFTGHYVRSHKAAEFSYAPWKLIALLKGPKGSPFRIGTIYCP
ncbi:hypothetical protein SAMD00023353_1400180 [Rosellinia necatrix]|uniref:Uncharacterized protein n=1 Tax=Rosellinia necatrix TaxID=77044 RepID=A0A1S8A6V5_ROSNE|nr:hypothetical protein SAMD00023353_1400180 [Rosellinia necatrix]